MRPAVAGALGGTGGYTSCLVTCSDRGSTLRYAWAPSNVAHNWDRFGPVLACIPSNDYSSASVVVADVLVADASFTASGPHGS